MKICGKNPDFLKNGQKCGELYTIDLITFIVLSLLRNILYSDNAKVTHCFVSMATPSIFILLTSRVVTRTHHIAYLVQFLWRRILECLPNYDLDGIWKDAKRHSHDICPTWLMKITTVRIFAVLAKIRTVHIPNTSLEPYRRAILLNMSGF